MPPPGGFEDDIQITQYNSSFSVGDPLHYHAVFDDEDPFGDYMTTWFLKMEIYPSGQNYTYKYLDQGQGGMPTYVDWSFNAGALPSNGPLIRNNLGQVLGKLTVWGADNDGYTHTDQRWFGINKDMKKLLFIILTAISIQAISQEFAPIGAKWHYDQGTFNPDLTTYQTFEAISDTIINGIPCRKLMKISRLTGTEISYLYMYSVTDSVFFYAGNGFHLLYDFGAITGDTITLGYYITYDGSPLKMIIDSTSTIIINGETRKLQYVSCGDGMVIEFGGIVIEGIGNIGYMFPSFDPSLDGPLRCYEDSNLGLFINPYHPNNGWNFQDCEQIITGIAGKEKTADIMIYPNPATHFLKITDLDRPTEYTFFDIQGKAIKSGMVVPSQLINLRDIPAGLYFLKIRNSKLLTIKKIVKE